MKYRENMKARSADKDGGKTEQELIETRGEQEHPGGENRDMADDNTNTRDQGYYTYEAPG